MADEEVTTDVGTELLFENARVRVWQMTLAPGEASPMHKHLHDHVFVYADDSEMEGRFSDAPEVLAQPVKTGFVYYREVGPDGLAPHFLTNAGTKPSTHFIVELLGESASGEAREAEHNGRFLTAEAPAGW